MNNITLEEKIQKLQTYSTEETDTGKRWIDGRKIYRKVVTYYNTEKIGAKGEVTNIEIAHNIQNFALCMHCEVFTSNYFRIPNISSTDGKEVSVGHVVNSVNTTRINLRLINDTFNPTMFYFILEYVKE